MTQRLDSNDEVSDSFIWKGSKNIYKIWSSKELRIKTFLSRNLFHFSLLPRCRMFSNFPQITLLIYSFIDNRSFLFPHKQRMLLFLLSKRISWLLPRQQLFLISPMSKAVFYLISNNSSNDSNFHSTPKTAVFFY